MKYKITISISFIIIVLFVVIFYTQSPQSPGDVVNDVVDKTTLRPHGTVASATCKYTGVTWDIYPGDKFSKAVILEANGNVAGPVGTIAQARFWSINLGPLIVDQNYSFDFNCGAWSKKDGKNIFTQCLREEGQPETTDWSAKWSNAVVEGEEHPLALTVDNVDLNGTGYSDYEDVGQIVPQVRNILCK
jgi:hypothetical protein